MILFDIKYPIIQAPMAGGATTPELISEVSDFGGLGSLGAAFLSGDAIKENIDAIRAKTDKPFNVNLFVPELAELDEKKLKLMDKKLEPYLKKYDLDKPEPKAPFYPANINDQIDAIIERNVSIVSFTFGIPEKNIIDKLKNEGVTLIGTATTVEEALAIEKAGFDIVVAQGSDAGGHRGTFLRSYQESMIGTMALVPQVVDAVSIPVIAAGGIMDKRGIAAALALGADAVQMGTAFLTCLEAGIPGCYKQKLLNTKTDSTIVTKVFTGRPARGIQNEFTQALANSDHELLDFPIQGSLTKTIRQAASKEKNTELMSIWAGQAASLSKALTVEALMKKLTGN